MANNTNLYLDKILLEHPTAAWTLGEQPNLSDFLQLVNIDYFYSVQTPVAIPTQTTSNGGGYMSFNTTGPHNLRVGEYITISGLIPLGYNSKYKVYSVSSSTSFTVLGSTTGNITDSGQLIKNIDAYELQAYNSEKYKGYVLASDPLSPKLPLALGSKNSQEGSFLLPSFGFLSNDGRYGQYTLETWIKIKKTDSKDKFKLIGLMNINPLFDDGNGLYYNDNCFILKIGTKSDKVFIKQMNKPMLIHITYSENLVSLFVNGEQLINLVLEEKDLDLLQNPANTENYLAFQSAIFDCPAIYPYKLSGTQAKIHYHYGQAADMPETIIKSYGESTIAIDHKSAGYSSNLKYPSNSEWKNAIFDGIDVGQYSISNKEFDLPTFNFYNPEEQTFLSKEDFISALSTQPWTPKYGSFSTINSNVEFESLDMLGTKVEGFYIDCYATSLPSTAEKTIFKIVNKINNNHLRITLQYVGSNIEVKYRFKYNSGSEVLLATKTNPHYFASTPGIYNYLIGIEIDKFSQQYSRDVFNFFYSPEYLTVFALGDNNLEIDTTPNVSVRAIKFLSQYQLDKLNTILTNSDGTFFYPANAYTPTTTEAKLNSAVSNYEIKYIQNKKTYNTAYIYSSLYFTENYFSVGTSGYWKDETPLMHFAKYVKDGSNNDIYTFNNLQFNIDYDAPITNTVKISGVWYFDTSNSDVKTYITFESVNSNYREDSYFTNGIKQLSLSRVVVPDSNWQTTKYEVVDGTIVYPPNGVDISTLKIVTHIEISVSDTTNNRVETKSLELSSQALSLNSLTENPISTKYQAKITPYTYTVSGGTRTYNYSGNDNAKNPFILEKNTSPYLSLERLSGVRLLTLDTPVAGVFRGIRFDINKTENVKSKIKSIQMFLYNDSKEFNLPGGEIFNIVDKDGGIFSTILGTSGTTPPAETYTLPISTKNGLGATISGIQYYINGKLEAFPKLKTNEWTVLTMVFPTPISFDGASGEFNITGPLAIDNIVFYGMTDREYTGGQNNASNALKIYGSFMEINILDPGQYNREDRITAHDMQYNVYADYKTAKYTYDAN